MFILVAAIGARFLTAMCLGFGLLWNIPLIGNYVDPAIAFCLWFLLEAMQACVRLKGAIVELVGSISNMVLAAMRKITCRRIYEVVAWLCFVLLCIYVAFALLFAAGTTVVAAQALSAMWVSASTATPESISLAATFAVGLCFVWIPGILYFCRHLLLLYICRW